MNEGSEARDTLRAAEFFLQRAEEVGFDDREVLRRYMAAAIVFGRSVTFHLQKEFAHADGFAQWYETEQQNMRADEVCRFFVEARNLTIKEGLLPVNQATDVTINVPVAMSVAVAMKVKRASPIWRRRPRIIWQDVLRVIAEASRKAKALFGPSQSRPTGAGSIKTVQRPFFDYPDRRGDSAFVVVRQYLTTLDDVVRRAEEKFAGPL